MNIYRSLLIVIIGGLCPPISGQQSDLSQTKEIFLYPKKEEVIGEEHIRDQGGNLIVGKITNPSITVFTPFGENAGKAAVIICPGGGYSNLHIQREGFRIAKAFNEKGIAAFVLKYRLPDEEIVSEKSFVPLKDAQCAIQLVRENAKQWNIAADKIGIMGFSAGGHLASSAGVHYDSLLIENKQNTNIRPDFMILVYPVISFNNEVGHMGSSKRLLGEQQNEGLVRYFSNELHVNADTPKSILFHAGDDTIVAVENSLRFYSELQKNNIPAELHIYSKGEHGFLNTPSFEEWFMQCIRWMKAEQIYSP